MVKFDSAIDQLIPVLRQERNLPGPDFVKSIIMAFIDIAALDNIEDCSRKSDHASIKNFLMVYTATENFVSDLAKLADATENIPVGASILPVLSLSASAAAATVFVPAAAAAATVKATTNSRTEKLCYNCNEPGHTLYRCPINCQFKCCPRTNNLELYGKSSVSVHTASCCPLRRNGEKFAALIRTKPVGRPAVLNSRNPSACSLPLPVQTLRTYLGAARTSAPSQKAAVN